MIPGVALRNAAGRSLHGTSAVVQSATAAFVGPASELLSFYPLTAGPVRAVLAVGRGQGALAVLWLAAGVALLAALIELGARLAVREALNREAPPVSAAAGDDGAAEHRWTRLLPRDLAVLVGREVRTFRRTPQVLMGLLMAPLLLLVFGAQQALGGRSWPFVMALVSLVSALNLSANQFGLDQAGVRLLLLLPVPPRRLIVAKNLACVIVVALTAVGCLVVGLLRGPRLDLLGGLTALAMLAAALPVVLMVGNHLSIAHPWRMTFRLGGAPPGAMASAFAQMAALGAVGLVLVPPLLLLPLFFGDGLVVRLGSVAIIAAAAAGLWLLWRARLARSASALEAGRERLIDRLARAEETG
jgi:hypothetical protein